MIKSCPLLQCNRLAPVSGYASYGDTARKSVFVMKPRRTVVRYQGGMNAFVVGGPSRHGRDLGYADMKLNPLSVATYTSRVKAAV